VIRHLQHRLRIPDSTHSRKAEAPFGLGRSHDRDGRGLLLSVAAPGHAALASATTTVVVHARTADPADPVDTGIHVVSGATYTIDASGSTHYCGGVSNGCPSGPDGATNPAGFGCAGAPPCPVSSALLGTLIGKIGSGSYFVVGSHDSFTAGLGETANCTFSTTTSQVITATIAAAIPPALPSPASRRSVSAPGWVRRPRGCRSAALGSVAVRRSISISVPAIKRSP
jgi:hypothetical protein